MEIRNMVKDAKAVTIITSIGNDYKNDYPEYRTGEMKEQVASRVRLCRQSSGYGRKGLYDALETGTCG